MYYNQGDIQIRMFLNCVHIREQIGPCIPTTLSRSLLPSAFPNNFSSVFRKHRHPRIAVLGEFASRTHAHERIEDFAQRLEE